MSNLSKVVSNLQQTSSKQKEIISETYSKTLTELESDLQSKLKEKLTTISNDTDQSLSAFQSSQKKKLDSHLMRSSKILEEIEKRQKQTIKERRFILKDWIKEWLAVAAMGVILVLALSLGTWGLMRYLATEIQKQLTQITENQETIETLEKNRGWIQFSLCDKKLCVQIDQKEADIYEGGYMILKKK